MLYDKDKQLYCLIMADIITDAYTALAQYTKIIITYKEGLSSRTGKFWQVRLVVY